MNHYQLTIDNLQPVTFWADNSQLKYQLNSAYIAFKNKHNLSKTILYVHHPIHGWCLVCNAKNYYPVINNPLLLDYTKLVMAITHTLAQAALFPTAKQKQEKIEKDLHDERNINAEIQRSAFHIVRTSEEL